MSIESPISPSLQDAHQAATDSANRWRGHCVDKFTRAEACLRDAFAAAAAHPNGAALQRPSLFGQHVAAMKEIVRSGGPFEQAGAKVQSALAECEGHFAWRNILFHAVSSVWIDRQCNWLWQYRFQPMGENKQLEFGVITEADAMKLEKELSRAIDSLNSHLKNFSTSLGK